MIVLFIFFWGLYCEEVIRGKCKCGVMWEISWVREVVDI